MAQYGVAVTKSVTFRGVAQEFGNTYHYTTATGATDTVLDALLDAIVAKEKAIFATSVTFVRGKVWTSGGTKAENNMRVQKNLSGVGSLAYTTQTLDKERAWLVRFRAGNDSRGNPVYLRKWWHLDGVILGGSTLTTGQQANTSQLDSAQRTALQNAADGFKSIVAPPNTFQLVAESGRQIDGATLAHPYLEHRQLGDMWR